MTFDKPIGIYAKCIVYKFVANQEKELKSEKGPLFTFNNLRIIIKPRKQNFLL